MYAYIDSFRKFGKTNTDNQSIKIKRPYPEQGFRVFRISSVGNPALTPILRFPPLFRPLPSSSVLFRPLPSSSVPLLRPLPPLFRPLPSSSVPLLRPFSSSLRPSLHPFSALSRSSLFGPHSSSLFRPTPRRISGRWSLR